MYFTGIGEGRTAQFSVNNSPWTIDWDTDVLYCGGFVGHIRLFKPDPIEIVAVVVQKYIMRGGRVLVYQTGTFFMQVGLCSGAEWTITVYDEVLKD